MMPKSQKEILTKWELYTPQQKEVILAEFRKKLPDDYYCKNTFFDYLKEKLGVAGDGRKVGFRAVTK